MLELARAGTTVLVTTHYLDEAEHCHRIAIIQAGRLAALGTIGELKQAFEGRPILEVRAPRPGEAMRRLDAKPAVEKTSLFGTTVHAVLRDSSIDPQEIAHFLIRLLFCLFAEDIGLLPERLFPRLLDQTRRNSKDFSEVLRQLFRAMNTGGYFGADKILHFNGGLFDSEEVLPLDSATAGGRI